MHPHLSPTHVMRFLLKGQSPARMLMNGAMRAYTIRGHVVDVGGGRKPDYFDFLQKEGAVTIEALDGSISGINFEEDPLPYPTDTVDTALLCNVLEHMYRYPWLLSEIHRMLKPGSELIGFVPFWVGYHPDPRDFFRYTREALERIFADAGFVDVRITEVGGGPFMANFNTIALSMPRPLRPLVYLGYALGDWVFVRLRPGSVKQHPLGFAFVVRKPQS